jgi:hypothetical protein
MPPRSLLAAAVGLVLLEAPREVLAAPITFTFTGNVPFVGPELAGTFNTSQTLTGSYTIE